MSYSKLRVNLIDLLLFLLGCAAVVNATCENATCLRFYNAECRDDHCSNPPCEPHFFWRNNNVTDRCDIASCDTKTCTDTRQCMEEIITVQCKQMRGCRQYLKAKCVLVVVERPMTCSDITCDPGTICRLREREGNLHPIVRCIPAERLTTCENIRCDPGFYCRDDRQVVCVPNPTTEESTTEEPTTQEPTTAELTTQDPTTAELTTQEPTTAELTTQEPTTAGLTTEEPTTAELTTQEPTTAELTTQEPTTAELTTEEPTTAELTQEPTTAELTTQEPTTAGLTTEEPTAERTTREPTTAGLTTEEPTTAPDPTSPEITTQAPTTTEPPLRVVAPSCDALNCPLTLPVCQITQIPDLNATVAMCTSSESSAILEDLAAQNENSTCDLQSCQDNEECIESYGERIDNSAYCSILDCSLSDNSTCPSDTRCIAVPSNFTGSSAESACIPNDVDLIFDISCASDNAPVCGPGMTCANTRSEEAMIGSYCTPLPSFSTVQRCTDLECAEELVCAEVTYEDIPTFHYAVCTGRSGIVQLIQEAAGGCETLQCEDDQSCITFKQTGISICSDEQFARTCADLECSDGNVCSVFTLPSDPTTLPLAFCTIDLESTIKSFEDFSCSNVGSSICSGSPCVDGVQSRRQVGTYCTECSERPSACLTGQVCIELPSDLASTVNVSTICSLDNMLEFGLDCKSRKEPCTGGLYCTEAKLDDTVVASFCQTLGLHTTCELVTCGPGNVCAEVLAGQIQYATCGDPKFLNIDF